MRCQAHQLVTLHHLITDGPLAVLLSERLPRTQPWALGQLGCHLIGVTINTPQPHQPASGGEPQLQRASREAWAASMQPWCSMGGRQQKGRGSPGVLQAGG